MRLFEGYGRQVHVRESVVRVWDNHRQTGRSVESFGVLVRTTSMDRKAVWVDAVTTPTRRDRRWRLGFQLADHGHGRTVRRMFERSCRQRIYLGTWHTHPEFVPRPSGVDTNDWLECLRANPGRPLVFVVVGTEQACVFVRAGRVFRALRAEGER